MHAPVLMQGTERQVHELRSCFRSGKIFRTSAKYKPLYIHSRTNCLRRSILTDLFRLRVWPKVINYNDVRYESLREVASPWQVMSPQGHRSKIKTRKNPPSQRESNPRTPVYAQQPKDVGDNIPRHNTFFLLLNFSSAHLVGYWILCSLLFKFLMTCHCPNCKRLPKN
jgi:hypothetical protein